MTRGESKPTIFLSHVTEEAELASLFKKQIETSFLGLVNVFQSSDPGSMPVGRNWLDNITRALRGCQAILLFCSPYSIGRPWINFEAGAGWARDIEVAPLCHSGMRPVDLPVPMSLLQGVEANDATRLDQVFGMIAAKLGSAVPSIDSVTLADKVRAFELSYVAAVELKSRVEKIASISKPLLATLAQAEPETVHVINGIPERIIERLHETLDALQSRGDLSYKFEVLGMGFGGEGAGTFGNLTVRLSRTLCDTIRAKLGQVE